VAGNVPVVEIGDPEIKKDIEEKGKVKECGIQTIRGGSHFILNCAVDPEDPKRLDQQVQKE